MVIQITLLEDTATTLLKPACTAAEQCTDAEVERITLP